MDGFASIGSDDEETDKKFFYTDNSIEIKSFNCMSINEWANVIRKIFAEGSEHYNYHIQHQHERLVIG